MVGWGLKAGHKHRCTTRGRVGRAVLYSYIIPSTFEKHIIGTNESQQTRFAQWGSQDTGQESGLLRQQWKKRASQKMRVEEPSGAHTGP